MKASALVFICIVFLCINNAAVHYNEQTLKTKHTINK